MNVNNFAYCLGFVAVGCIAYVALQQILGLLPERWFGIGSCNSTGAGSGRTPVVMVEETTGILVPSFPFQKFLGAIFAS
jgi:hypothetical protein